VKLLIPCFKTLCAVGGMTVLFACTSQPSTDSPPATPSTPATPATPPVSAACPDLRPGTARAASAQDKEEATDETVERAQETLDASEQAIANAWRNRTFEEFEACVARDPASGNYIVDGDIQITDRKHLEEFFEKVKNPDRRRGLILHQEGGVDARWSDAQKNSLTYCVSNTFGTNKAKVVSAMASATGAWQKVAQVKFAHDTAQDANCTASNNQVVFDVRPITGADYLARAFFPNDFRSNRNVIIDQSAIDLPATPTATDKLTLVGVLRHELGHALGFRHEHTRPQSGTCFEDNNWRPLTSYDSFSVMHYPQCNGTGDWSLTLTRTDKNGAACLYGPAPGFTIDTNICNPATPPPTPPACGPKVETFSGNVATSAQVAHGPFVVTPGARFKASMTGTGDPDLYVRYDAAPTTTSYDCRPYLTGAVETCDLTVPAAKQNAFIMIRGYAAGTYQLTVEH
jgi:serine protease